VSPRCDEDSKTAPNVLERTGLSTREHVNTGRLLRLASRGVTIQKGVYICRKVISVFNRHHTMNSYRWVVIFTHRPFTPIETARGVCCIGSPEPVWTALAGNLIPVVQHVA